MREREITLHARADYSPAQCVTCGASEQLIDIGAPDIPGYGVTHGNGRVYLCVMCTAEIATALGYVDGDLAERREQALRQQATEVSSSVQRRITVTPDAHAAKEFQDAVATAARRYSDRVLSAGDGGADLPVPVDAPSLDLTAGAAAGSGSLSVRGGGSQVLDTAEIVRRSTAGDAGLRSGPQHGVDDAIVGEERPDADEGLEWIPAADEGDSDSALLDGRDAGE